MSDGPHRSLPMRPAWRRVAERGDKRAYTPQEISQALAPALEQDCRDDMRAEFIGGIRRVIEEPSLFSEDVGKRLQALRPEAGSGIGRAVLDNVELLSASNVGPVVLLQEALRAALEDRAARGARQVEEHYLRESSTRRADNVRGRLEAGIACTEFDAIATRVLSVDARSAPRGPMKQTGLDDGVSLR
jgi:hypothetical protein